MSDCNAVKDSFANKISDLNKIKEIGYNPKLWESSKIKRLKEEEKAIEKFEKEHSFYH